MRVRRLGIWLFPTWLLFAIGCQESPSGALSAPGVGSPKNTLARLLPTDPCADPSVRTAVGRELLDAVNAERAKHKLRPLKADATLTQIADFYACRLIEGGFFAHDDPFDGSSIDVRAANFGYAFVKIGENLAAGQQGARETLEDWLASPGHRANLLDPAFTEIGIAVKIGGEFGVYWVVEFGRPLTSLDELPTAEPVRPVPTQPTR